MFAGFGRSDDGMSAGACMLCRVTIRRTITTMRRPTRLTRPQVHPSLTNLHTLVTLVLFGRFNARNSCNMDTARIRHTMDTTHIQDIFKTNVRGKLIAEQLVYNPRILNEFG